MKMRGTLALLTVTSASALTRGAFNRLTPTALLGSLLGGNGDKYPGAIMGDESIMSAKAHGTSKTPVQQNLRWKCSVETADKTCNFNRHYAEYAGYWERETSFLSDLKAAGGNDAPEITFYDSNTGNPLFTAPRGRTWEQFVAESRSHGWPSFRDEETNWDFVRVLQDGEAVSVDGTHLGHNLPDGKGNRYCINLVSVAGNKA